MTTQLKAIRLCLQRRFRYRRRLLCCRFRAKILKIRRLKILLLLAPFAAWPWRPWRCNKLSTPCHRVRRVGSVPPISLTRKRRFQHRPSSTALSIGWRRTTTIQSRTPSAPGPTTAPLLVLRLNKMRAPFDIFIDLKLECGQRRPRVGSP